MPRCYRCQLALAVAPLVASLCAQGGWAAQPMVSTLTIQRVHAAQAPRAGSPIVALPLNAPTVNGFQPLVVFGLTDEHDNDFVSPPSAAPGGTTIPNPVRYFVGTLDSGSSAHIMGYEDSNGLLHAAGYEGTNTVDLFGASGSIAARVSDGIGVYATGLANATAGVNGPITGPLIGTTNTPILTIDDPPEPGELAFPNILGAPAFAYNQVAILNSQTQRISFNGTTYQGPQIEFRDTNSPTGPGFARVELTPLMPGGAIEPVVFQFDPFKSNWSKDPYGPAVWNGLYADVDLGNNGQDSNNNQFLFDTGAQLSVLSKSVANSIGISTNPDNPTPPDFTVEALGVGGVTTLPGYIIDSLGLLTDLGENTTWTNVPVIVANLPDPRDNSGFVPGILGMNLFNDRDLIINTDISFDEGTYLAFTRNIISPMWTGTAGGNWGDNSKWTLGVPSSAENPANFTSATPAPQTITVDDDYTLGRIKFDNAAPYTINGPGRLTLEMVVGAATIDVVNGSHAIHAPMTLVSDTIINVAPAASHLSITNDVTATGVDVVKSGLGVLEMKNVRAGSLTLDGGTVRITPGGTNAATSILNDISATNGALDLQNNNLIARGTANGGSATLEGITSLIAAGRNGGTWDGDGIVTSMSDAGPASQLTTLAVATAGDVGKETFAGFSVAATDLLVMYTYAGDANLSGAIDADDYFQIDRGFAGSLSGYFNGDFDYNSFVDGDDYFLIDANYAAQGAAFAAAPTAVPEPTTLVMALAAWAVLHPRRRP